MITGHGGNIYELARTNNCRPDDIIDMSSNLNPLGPPTGLLEHLIRRIRSVCSLPDAGADDLISRFETAYNRKPGTVLAGSGTTEFIYLIPRALSSKQVVIVGPTYADYQDACRQNRCDWEYFLTDAENRFVPDLHQLTSRIAGKDLVFLCNPNNPTGVVLGYPEIRRLCETHPETCFVIDESYLPFVPNARKISLAQAQLPNVMVLSSMSKMFSIPGLRTGFLIASPDHIKRLRQYLAPWNVNSLAQIAAAYILCHPAEMQTFIRETRAFLQRERSGFLESLGKTDAYTCFAGPAPYILIQLNNGMDAVQAADYFARDNILIRNCANFTGLLENYIRIALKDHQANQAAAEKLNQLAHHIP